MESVTEKGLAPGLKVGSTADQKSTGQEKKVIIQFRHREDINQPCMSRLPALAVPVFGSAQPATEPVQLSSPGRMLSPWCEHCESVRTDELGTSFRIFKDSTGKFWKCFMPLTCDHAIVTNGTMHSCRVRSREIHEAEAMNRETQISASYHGGRS